MGTSTYRDTAISAAREAFGRLIGKEVPLSWFHQILQPLGSSPQRWSIVLNVPNNTTTDYGIFCGETRLEVGLYYSTTVPRKLKYRLVVIYGSTVTVQMCSRGGKYTMVVNMYEGD